MTSKLTTAQLLRIGQRLVIRGGVLKILRIEHDRHGTGLRLKTRQGWRLLHRDEQCTVLSGRGIER